MKIQNDLNNTAVLHEIGARIRRLRIDSGVTQAEFAEKAGLSLRTISRIESGEDTQFSNLVRVLRCAGALENLNLLLPEEQLRPSQMFNGETLRQRVTKYRTASGKSTEWKWGDEQ